MATVKRQELLRLYVKKFLTGEIGQIAMRRHNPEMRGIIHLFFCKGFPRDDLLFMMYTIHTHGNPMYTDLEEDLKTKEFGTKKTVSNEPLFQEWFGNFKKTMEIVEKYTPEF